MDENRKIIRGNALQRTLKLMQALLQGKELDRHTAAELMKIQPAAADRQLKAIEKIITGVQSKRGKGTQRLYWFDKALLRSTKRPSKQSVLAACIGASLGALLDGRYKTAMRDAARDLMGRREMEIAEVERKFWFVRQGGETSLPDHEHFLDEFMDALVEHNPVSMKYEHFDGRADTLQIQPLTALIYDHQLYFIGRNNEGEFRPYRFSRVQEAERLDQSFEYPSKAEYDPDQVFQDTFGIFVWGDFPMERIRMRLSKRWEGYARTHRWHSSQRIKKIEDMADGREFTTELTFRLRVCPEFEQWIMGFGEEAKVLEPESLRRKIAERMKAAAAIYEKAGDSANKDRKLVKKKTTGKVKKKKGGKE